MGDSEQLVHIVLLDLRDTGLQELDVRPLCRLELLRCDRNLLSLLRVSGYTLKSLHAAHNGTNIYYLFHRSKTDDELSHTDLKELPLLYLQSWSCWRCSRCQKI